MFQDRLIEKYPSAKWVIVEREFPDVVESFSVLGIPIIDNRLTNIHYKLDELKLKAAPLIVPFDTLNCSIRDVAKFLNPEWKCPDYRHEMLINMNVQYDRVKGLKELSEIPVVNPLSESAEPPLPTKAQKDYFAVLREICGQNELAYRWMEQAILCATVIDHIADGDPIDYRLFDETMKGLILEWGINSFFCKYAQNLIPVMSTVLATWQHSAGEFARSSHYQVYTAIPCAVAFLLGGQGLVDKISPRLFEAVNKLLLEDNERDDQ